MKIDDRFLNYDIGKQIPTPASDAKEKIEKEKLSEEKNIEGNNQSGQDVVVNLSNSLKEAQLINEVSSSEPDIREDKVSALKTQIESGNYKVDPEAVADKLVDTFIDEII
jgi:negative regulator of flagellin synthesis FlgM